MNLKKVPRNAQWEFRMVKVVLIIFFTLTFTVEFLSGVPRDRSSLIYRSKVTHRLLIVSSSSDVTKPRDGKERLLFSYINSINLPKNDYWIHSCINAYTCIQTFITIYIYIHNIISLVICIICKPHNWPTLSITQTLSCT